MENEAYSQNRLYAVQNTRGVTLQKKQKKTHQVITAKN